MSRSLQHYRRLFPVTKHYAYLNHAGCTPLPQPGVESLARYWHDQSTQGVLCEPYYCTVIERARQKMAALIGADPSEIGWVQNTATAIELVAGGLDWREGDNVVTVHGEFPANVYPWLALRRFGVDVKLVQPRGGRVLPEDIAGAMDRRTRLVSLSLVSFATGNRVDLPAIAQLCEERGVLLNVDAIQGLGAVRFDVRQAGAHFVGAGVHKWLMGPHGVGLLYIRRDVLDRLTPASANWASVVNRDDYLNYGQPWIESAARVEGSTRNMSGLVAFDAVLSMILEVGIARIEARIMQLTDRLIAGLLAKGYELVSSTEPHERSGIVSFKPRGDPAELLVRAQAEGIVIAVRVGAIRVSPHFYNTEDEIDRLLALL